MRRLTLALILVVLVGTPVSAAVVTIPQTALVPSTTYYTDVIGGGIGPVAVMTGGGNAANVGVASGRNDDGFMGRSSVILRCASRLR